jgi:hypothetical protein
MLHIRCHIYLTYGIRYTVIWPSNGCVNVRVLKYRACNIRAVNFRCTPVFLLLAYCLFLHSVSTLLFSFHVRNKYKLINHNSINQNLLGYLSRHATQISAATKPNRCPLSRHEGYPSNSTRQVTQQTRKLAVRVDMLGVRAPCVGLPLLFHWGSEQ